MSLMMHENLNRRITQRIEPAMLGSTTAIFAKQFSTFDIV
jgi:hypothetical protein